MPLSGKTGRKRSCNRSCVTAQKVVIPKGMINPDETTVIEIPCRLHKQPVVVAKPRDTAVSSPSEEENTGMRSSRSRSPRNSRDSFNSSFHSANMQQGGECDFIPRSSIEERNFMEVDFSNGKKNTDMSFNPDFHSTNMQQGGQCGFASPNAVQDISNNIMAADTNADLDETEEQERVQLQSDLEAFQKARRKLIERTSKLATQMPTIGAYDGNAMYNSNYEDNLAACSTSDGYSSFKNENRMIDPRFDQKEYARQLYNVL